MAKIVFGPTGVRSWRSLYVAALAIFLCGLCFGVAGWSQEPAKPPTPTPRSGEVVKEMPASETHHELTAADLEPFLDGMMPAQLERENIAGAVISVVKDGRLLFAKGYGYSD